jgi:2-keto-4-pentenoate hydratase/2-oxohepta-3-ene-1,7-dioic acid hydratase in catechol pathway
MHLFSTLVAVTSLLIPGAGVALEIEQPFKVGTFEIGGSPQIGIVLYDRLIIELKPANAALEKGGMHPELAMPAGMLALIERYENGMKQRLYDIVNEHVRNNRLGDDRPGYVHAVENVRALPPIMYPGKILNAAVNFYTHVDEAGSAEERKAAQQQRRDARGVPYLFLKPSRGAVVGNGDSIVIPYGRDRIDWEVELGAVVGKTAKYVSADDAEAHIFGYMVSIDVSDRGGRPPGGAPFGLDWFVGKGHDTFAPQGPWIVPKEFYGDPMKILRQSLSVGDEQMQEGTAGDMIHTLWELVEYASSIITLYPGDVINNGTSGGTGAGTAVRGAQRFLQPGEVVTATIDGIGSLIMPVVAESKPEGLSGAQLSVD